MPVVAVDLLHRCARIGNDDREAVQLHVGAEQRTENSTQQRVCEPFRPGECAAHPHRDLEAGIAARIDRIGRRAPRLLEHPARVERAVARDIFLVHGFDQRDRKRARQQQAAMLAESGVRRAQGFGEQLAASALVRRRRDHPFHGRVPGPCDARHRRHGAYLHRAIKPVAPRGSRPGGCGSLRSGGLQRRAAKTTMRGHGPRIATTSQARRITPRRRP